MKITPEVLLETWRELTAAAPGYVQHKKIPYDVRNTVKQFCRDCNDDPELFDQWKQAITYGVEKLSLPEWGRILSYYLRAKATWYNIPNGYLDSMYNKKTGSKLPPPPLPKPKVRYYDPPPKNIQLPEFKKMPIEAIKPVTEMPFVNPFKKREDNACVECGNKATGTFGSVWYCNEHLKAKIYARKQQLQQVKELG